MRARRRECLTCTAKASGSTTSRPRCGGPVLGIAEQNTRPRCGVQNTGRGGPRQGGWPLRANRRRRAAGGAERLCRPAAREPVAASSQLRHARDLTPAGRRGKRLQRPARHHGDQSGRRRPAAHRRGRGGGAEAPGGGRPHALLHRGRDAVARARLPRHPMGRAARAAQAGRQVRREPCTPELQPLCWRLQPDAPRLQPKAWVAVVLRVEGAAPCDPGTARRCTWTARGCSRSRRGTAETRRRSRRSSTRYTSPSTRDWAG